MSENENTGRREDGVDLTEPARIAHLVSEVAAFCWHYRGRCFENWDLSKVFKYLCFQACAGCLFIERDRGGNVTAVAVAWTGNGADFVAKEKKRVPQFNWIDLPKAGDSLLISQVFGQRNLCGKLFEQARAKWPQIEHVFTYRRKAGARGQRPELIALSPELLNRFFMKGGSYLRA